MQWVLLQVGYPSPLTSQKRLDDFPSLSKYIKRYDILEENRIKDTVYRDTGKYNFLYSHREIDNL